MPTIRKKFKESGFAVVPNHIQNDYHAPDRDQVLADPTRWGPPPSSAPAGATIQPKTPLGSGQTSTPIPPSSPAAFDPNAFGADWARMTQGRSGTNADFDALWPELQRLYPDITRGGSSNDKITLPGNLGWFDGVLASGEGGRGYNPFSLQAHGSDSGGGSSGGTGYGNDPASSLYLNEVLSRLETLRQPINDPFRSLYELMGLLRAEELQGDPYTQGEDDALRTRYMAPLTQARDAALDRQQEELGRFGYLPSSGLAIDQRGDIDRAYQSDVARNSNDLAVRAIDEKQRRERESLAVLSDLLGLQVAGRAEDDARGRELVSTAKQVPDFDSARLDQLLRASGDGASQQNSILSALLSILGSNRNQANFDQLRSDREREFLGEIFGSFLEGVL